MKRLLLSLYLICGSALASEWIDVASTPGQSIQVDKSTLMRKGAVVKGWTKSTFDDMQTKTSKDGTKVEYAVSKDYEIWNCDDRTHDLLSVTDFGDLSETQIVDHIDFTDYLPLNLKVVSPDSVGEAVMEYACKVTASKKAPSAKKTHKAASGIV